MHVSYFCPFLECSVFCYIPDDSTALTRVEFINGSAEQINIVSFLFIEI